MGQRYEGTLIIQTNDYYSPVGSKILTPVENPASSDDVVPGKGLYDSNGNYIGGSLVDGWPVEIDTEEGMDAFVTLENVNRYAKYTGMSSAEPTPPTPVNPIAVGDEITKFYFNTLVAPNFLDFDLTNAVEKEGVEELTLLGGTAPNYENTSWLEIGKVPSGYTVDIEGTKTTFTTDQYVIVAGSVGETVYLTEEYAKALGAEEGWFNTTLDTSFTVTSVSQQDIWGAYISKDGKWTNSTTSKYASGQIYQVVRQGESAELKPIQY